jgi:hypothetical protein
VNKLHAHSRLSSVVMILEDCDGANRLAVQVSGYQFPDAPNPALRYSWHMVSGQAVCDQGSWEFRWQALTCDESPRVSKWLTTAADSLRDQRTVPRALDFTEPNLQFAAGVIAAGKLIIEVRFDLEFRPPWHRRGRGAGNPFSLTFAASEQHLREAASQWDAERAPLPDNSP